MYNDFDEEYVSDLDEDIKRREALLHEVRNMGELNDWRIVSNLQRQWKAIPYWDNAYEDTLMEEFDSYMDAFYSKRKAGYQNNGEQKKALIKEAQEALVLEDDRLVQDKMNALFEEWKQCGSAGKEEDDSLWESFNAVRLAFFERKKQNWEDLQQKFEQARLVKTELVEKARELLAGEDLNVMNEEFKQLMKRWKEMGSAGKEFEDSLWTAFQESRQQFFDRRDAYYETLHEEQDQRFVKKQELIARAKEIESSKTFTRENTIEMKNLNIKWKEIGPCGKDKENEIWANFRSIADAYFSGLKQFNEQKHLQWRQRMMDQRNRKLELIANQKRQIKYLEDELVGLLGERAIEDTKDEIEEKREFIVHLEEEIEELNKVLLNE